MPSNTHPHNTLRAPGPRMFNTLVLSLAALALWTVHTFAHAKCPYIPTQSAGRAGPGVMRLLAALAPKIAGLLAHCRQGLCCTIGVRLGAGTVLKYLPVPGGPLRQTLSGLPGAPMLVSTSPRTPLHTQRGDPSASAVGLSGAAMWRCTSRRTPLHSQRGAPSASAVGVVLALRCD